MNIRKLILEGEGLQVDFKKTISSYEKIARTLTAFANTKGGKLLVGVEDNGEVTGLRSEEEEKFMLVTAGRDYCKPPVIPGFEEVYMDNKLVLVAEIPESGTKPHFALAEDGKWWAYVRVNDKSILASPILVQVLKKKGKKENVLLEFTEREKRLMDYLQEHELITFRDYCRLAGLNRKKASRVLVNLILMGLVKVQTTEKMEYYRASGVK
ncbi:putative DNA-binding protein [Anseongella ginsenosidimutans]|uniref:Putative DNA-binding protein n=1 Tax=Anseongella ginsenosidimutans TaxID=496056 RepID=A0A4R3KT13_9SPHI|nr:ATP-binding protein [Anseongella ginsenosidimutans]QEC53121.1 ATP-binding protein [Anseongella ginsenosidimutans]TCS87739.1 putative DNA-binding protein [Anseongella ginsenosidimutans]